MGRLAAGDLNKRVTFLRRVVDKDETGQPTDEWVPVATVWANIRTRSGVSFLESIHGDAEIARTSFSVRVRRNKTIHTAMRMRYAGDTYEIRGVLPDEEGGEYMDVAVSLLS